MFDIEVDSFESSRFRRDSISSVKVVEALPAPDDFCLCFLDEYLEMPPKGMLVPVAKLYGASACERQSNGWLSI